MSCNSDIVVEVGKKYNDETNEKPVEYIGRVDGGKGHMNSRDTEEDGWLGNPYTKEDYGRERCIEKFREDFEKRLEDDEEFRQGVKNLAGHRLLCWCQTVNDDGPACHGEVIREWVFKMNEAETP